MEEVISSPKRLRGELSVPGDKSISHRSLILNALGTGTAYVNGLSSGQDVLSTKGILQNIGVSIIDGEKPGEYKITGCSAKFTESPHILDAGNSGTSMRLISGLLASANIFSVLSGDASLNSRPMGRVIDPLTEMGATILGRKDNSLAPFAINGGDLNGITYTMPVASAQVKSCLLIAGLSANTSTTLIQPAVSRDHTELMLTAMGGQISTKDLELTIQPSKLQSIDVAVPGDISSAAFWMIAALCHPDAELTIHNIGINPSRTGILTALQMMGASDSLKLVSPRIEGGEQVADIEVSSSRLKGVELSGDLIPLLIDEIPIIALAAVFAEGETLITDAEELRFKESDRISLTVNWMKDAGAKVEEFQDGMKITGTNYLGGGTFSSHGDHRLAMTLGIASLISQDSITINDHEASNVSYPGFWENLNNLG